MKQPVNVFWFRRDLRLEDNAGLYHALKGDCPVVPVFIFDRHILDDLSDKADARLEFIHTVIHQLQAQLEKKGSTLHVLHDTPLDAFATLVEKYHIQKVFTNHDYEPYALQRDKAVGAFLAKENIAFHTYKDQVIFEKDEVVKDNGEPYTVFTPYSRRWKSVLTPFYVKSYPTHKYAGNFLKQAAHRINTLEHMGFKKTGLSFPAVKLDEGIVKQYKDHRDIPGQRGTTHMGLHLRFGTVSIRQLAQKAQQLSETWLNELIWRDFFMSILWHFPHVGSGKSFRPKYDRIRWRNNEKEFELWCKGKTGYPIVDAGMRELNETGFMHNRVRMIVASFLTKHLLIDWRWGEAYFAEKLLDYDLSANNGNWQWAAGSGCDAAPYFRVFNPTLQTKKFDPELKYIRKWVPEVESFDYVEPIVQHEMARDRCLAAYKKALQE